MQRILCYISHAKDLLFPYLCMNLFHSEFRVIEAAMLLLCIDPA